VFKHNFSSKWMPLAICAALTVSFVGCSSDGDSETPETSAPAPVSTDAPTTDVPSEELFASYKGVTADSIKIAVMLLDRKLLKETAGVDLNWGDNEGQYQEAIDAINENGGVFGRMIDPIYIYVNPLSPTGYDEACVRVLEVEEVFAVIGFVRPASAALCYAGTGDTPFLGYLTDITSDVIAEAQVSLIVTNPLPERIDRALASAIAESGVLDGKKIAVIGNVESRNNLVIERLSELGYEVASATVTAGPTDDTVADATEFDALVQRWIAEGVNFIFDTAGLDRLLAAANRAGFEADWATNKGSILSASRFESGATEAEVARTVVVGEPAVETLYESGHPQTVECVDRWDRNHPDEKAFFYPGDEDIDNLTRIARACSQMAIFKLIAEAAGADLTSSSFTEAANNLGSFEVSLMPFGSLGEGKSDAADSLTLFTWSSEKKDFLTGEIFNSN